MTVCSSKTLLTCAFLLVAGIAHAQADRSQHDSGDQQLDTLLHDSTQADEGSRAPNGTVDEPLDLIRVSDTTPAQRDEPARQRRQPMLEEIIVTAQRREENLQDVPISITVFDQEQIANANIVNASDLATYTPSLSTNARLGGENATFTIRGFTQVMRTTSTVATYFADVVAPRGQSVQNSGDGAGPGALFDLQNLQVLKGPQGTLFGRNTTGGAVVIVPRKPTDRFEGYAEVSGGDYGLLRQQAVLNLPANDDFRLRLGVDVQRRDGYLNNVTGIGADDLGDIGYTAARASGVLDLTDTLENYTILSWVDSATNGYTAQLYACNPSPSPADNLLYTIFGRACQQQLQQQADAGQNGFYDLVSTVAGPRSTIEEWRLINTTTWDVTDSVRIKNILAFAHLVTENESDIFGTNFHATWDVDPSREIKLGLSLVNPGFPTTSQQTWVEELQFQGRAFTERLQWQVGAYYERSMPDGVSGMNSVGLISCEIATLNGDPAGYNCFDPFLGLPGNVRSFAFKTDYINRAVYAQASLELWERLTLTGGLRYTWDSTQGHGVKTFHTFAATIPQPPRVVVTEPESESEAPTGLLEFSYRPAAGVMAYAKYARGYRQGSINMAADPGIDTFKPEKVDAYEVGAKLSFEGRVPGRLATAVFYNDFTDMQLESGYLSNTSGSSTTIFNAGKSRIQGVEVEAFLQLLEDVSLSLSYSYLDTELLEQEDHTADVLQASGPLAALTFTPIAKVGDPLPFAPEHTAVASLAYRLPVAERFGNVEIGATYVYTGARRSAASDATPFAELQPFDLLNLNASWTSIWQSPLDLSVFATNVCEEEYLTFTSGTYNSAGYESRQTGIPRMIGARLRYSF